MSLIGRLWRWWLGDSRESAQCDYPPYDGRRPECQMPPQGNASMLPVNRSELERLRDEDGVAW